MPYPQNASAHCATPAPKSIAGMPEPAPLSDRKIVARYYRRPQVAKAIDRAGGRYFRWPVRGERTLCKQLRPTPTPCKIGGTAMPALWACTRSGIGNGTVTRGDGCAQPQ